MQALRHGECALTDLNLEGIDFDDRCATHFADMLRVNNTLTHLTIGALDQQKYSMNAKPIFEALKDNRPLVSLKISGHKLEMTEDDNTVIEALKTHPKLAVLSMGDYHFGNQIAKIIADVLEYSKTLTTIDLSKNNIDSNGIKYLSEQLTRNTTITNLDLQGNFIDDKGAEYLATMLVSNTKLTELNLEGNKITFKGMKIFLESLKSNRTLSNLNLSLQSREYGPNEFQLYALMNMLEGVLFMSKNITYIGLSLNLDYAYRNSLEDRAKSITQSFLPDRKITIVI